MSNVTCQTCPYVYVTDRGSRAELFYCRRLPPSPRKDQGDYYDYSSSLFPRVWPHDWCGEHPDHPARFKKVIG